MTPNEQALDALHTYFGYDSFRLGQDRVVDAILTGHDSLAVMPTGAGKSICYQVPATVMNGVTIVISPLVSLMRDQVDALDDAGIAAAFVNSTQSTDEQRAVISQAAQGKLRLLYVAPERLAAPSFRELCEHLNIAMIAVDEAHCVSQWGQDFRPSYLDIGGFIEGFVKRPIVAAFTATATEQVRADIVRMLNLHDPVMTVTGFDRPNLFLDVIRLSSKEKSEWITRYVQEHANDSGIIYCATRKETDAVAQELRQVGVTAAAYHAGLLPEDRAQAQRAFVNDDIQVVVATNAFGMGIDKSNVRFVIHHNMPESIEAYYQEAGRAGRDGEAARCTLLWNESDIVTRRRLLDMGNANDRLSAEEGEFVRSHRRKLLGAMIGYCRTVDCLHAYILRYFGQESGGITDGAAVDIDAGSTSRTKSLGKSNTEASRCQGCGNCSNCLGTVTSVDVTDIAQMISRCVHDLGQNFGTGMLVRVLRGSQAQDVLKRGLDRCPSYGKLRDINEAVIRDVINQMSADDYLLITEGRLPLVKFGALAAKTVSPDFSYAITSVLRGGAVSDLSTSYSGDSRSHHSHTSRVASQGDGRANSSLNPADEAMFQALRELRTQIAREIGKPPYIVFSDKTLHDMAHRRPTDEQSMIEVNGVGEHKLELYGQRFIKVITSLA
ncbi:RecQ family ATP-dependent DNA helicase [Bifidobacterium sp.]|jgi:ATP-dependent DNA helicase RecQ|uniref:RecQ family ATP-dependent DNA helicase n=1 Tax=Bifidobacterium sp. TaxID=41200 RepID=UPI0025BAC670|nr:RecQ family ATP-dependent DNA helicase [Bifidobacterium sp.]MCI1635452.1 RecQ family ATP-dependent DNA helicase [Bifidobacterium sp.]